MVNSVSSLQSKVNQYQAKVSDDNNKYNSASAKSNEAATKVSSCDSVCSAAASALSGAQAKVETAQAGYQAALSIPVEEHTDENGNVIVDNSKRNTAISEARELVSAAIQELETAKAADENAKKQLEQAKQEAETLKNEMTKAMQTKQSDETALASAKSELSQAEAKEANKNNNKKDTGVNGKIDNPFKQGFNGDCALLATVQAISETANGAQAIEDAISIEKDSNDKKEYNVHFTSVNETYKVSEDELKDAKRSDLYSTGDDDMTLLELAMEKCFEQSDDAVLRDSVDNYGIYGSTDENGNTYVRTNYLYGVNPSSVSYLLTGKTTQTDKYKEVMSKEEKDIIDLKLDMDANSSYNIESTIETEDVNGKKVELKAGKMYKAEKESETQVVLKEDNDNENFISKLLSGKKQKVVVTKEEYYSVIKNNDKNIQRSYIENKLDEYDKNPEGKVLVLSNNISNKTAEVSADDNYYDYIKDINGNTIEMCAPHAYAITDVEDDIVTFKNPWDTAKEYQITRDELYKLKNFSLFSTAA